MARFKSLPLVGQQTIVPYKIEGAITDADLGKPVKLTSADTVSLCAATDGIYGFITSVEVASVDGKVLVGVVIRGRVRCTLSGSLAVGAIAAAAANTAAGSAKGQNWGIVQAHVPDITSTTTLRDTTFTKNWTLISGAGTTGTDGVLECI